jgi:hypothetical protein
LKRRADEDREIRDRWFAENRAAIAAVTKKLDQQVATVESMRPAVAALELSRSKLATLASVGFIGVIIFGWIVQGIIKFTVSWIISHFQ